MQGITDSIAIPEWLRPALSLTLSASAALLYGAILGVAIARTLVEGQPSFSPGLLRAAEMLSGLVGSVVTAGFAHGKQPAEPVRASWLYPTFRPTRAAALKARVSSLGQSKLVGLGEIIGFYQGPSAGASDVGHPEQGISPAPAPARANPAAFVVGVLYFAVYFLVGAGAFVVTLMRPSVPELIANSAWVWMGTILSAAYAFFALGKEGN